MLNVFGLTTSWLQHNEGVMYANISSLLLDSRTLWVETSWWQSHHRPRVIALSHSVFQYLPLLPKLCDEAAWCTGSTTLTNQTSRRQSILTGSSCGHGNGRNNCFLPYHLHDVDFCLNWLCSTTPCNPFFNAPNTSYVRVGQMHCMLSGSPENCYVTIQRTPYFWYLCQNQTNHDAGFASKYGRCKYILNLHFTSLSPKCLINGCP